MLGQDSGRCLGTQAVEGFLQLLQPPYSLRPCMNYSVLFGQLAYGSDLTMNSFIHHYD